MVLLAVGATVVIGATAIVGYLGEPEPPIIIANEELVEPENDSFNWELAALALAGLGTLALAIATGTLAASTWQDVRASQRMAEASVEANRLVRSEQERRPRLTLAWDPEKGESIPAESSVRVRLRVHNAPGLRAAQGTRVLLDRCVQPDGKSVIFGSPALRWMGANPGHDDDPVVVFAGAWRVITLGQLILDRPAWRLKLGLDKPESFGTGTTYRLIVGSDEADAKFYDVIVGWREDPVSVKEVYNSLAIRINEVMPEELSW